MINSKTKVEAAIIVFLLGCLCTAGVKAIQTEYKVEEHEEQIKALSIKIDQISNDTSFIRGQLENRANK